MSADERIKWFHKKTYDCCYPNAYRISERFGISHTQATRDIAFLKKKLSAPLFYDKSKKGYYYSEKFNLPPGITTANDDDYVSALSSVLELKNSAFKNSTIQIQIPYNAIIELKNKLALLELKSFIKEKLKKNRYVCEFKSIELFLSIILTLDANIEIIEPAWLRDRLIMYANRAIKNNPLH